jgi:hypothetical protein
MIDQDLRRGQKEAIDQFLEGPVTYTFSGRGGSPHVGEHGCYVNVGSSRMFLTLSNT